MRPKLRLVKEHSWRQRRLEQRTGQADKAKRSAGGYRVRPGALSNSKQLLQRCQHRGKRLAADGPQSFEQPHLVKCPNLIEQNQSALPAERYRDPIRRWASGSGHGSYNDRAKVVMHLGGETTRQGRAFRISLPTVGSSVASQTLPRTTIRGPRRLGQQILARSAHIAVGRDPLAGQPCLGWKGLRIRRAPFSTNISASPFSPSCTSRASARAFCNDQPSRIPHLSDRHFHP